MLGLYAAITRQDPSGQPPEGWAPDQRLTREEALRIVHARRGLRGARRDPTGSLEPGKLADLVMLSHDVMTVAPPRHPLDPRAAHRHRRPGRLRGRGNPRLR